MGDDQQDEVEKLYRKFENDAHDKIKADRDNCRLVESGQPRNFLRNLVSDLMKFANERLDAEYQVKLCMLFAADFFEFGEYALALESYEAVVARCDSIPNELLATKYRVEGMQKVVKSNYAELMQLKNLQIAPMVVSKLLVCLQQLRHSLENVFELPSRQQEGLAWLVLNSCKLIMEIGQPLIWYSCGKYVTETILFGATAMEAVINLCTVRHMKFRMKMYSSVFYSALAHSVVDDASGLLEHAKKQVFELREREELDPPVPTASVSCLQRCQQDLAVMQFVLDFWKDPDSFSLSDAHLAKYYKPPAADILVIPKQSFADLCASECIRVHLLASGNTNEPFRKRSSSILKGIAASLAGYSPAQSPSGEEKREVPADASRTALYEKFTVRGLLESAVLAMFCSVEGVDAADTLVKLCSLGEELYLHHAAEAAGAPAATSSKDAAGEQADQESLDQLRVLLDLHKLMHDPTPGAARAKQVLAVVGRFESLTYSAHAYRARAFMKKVSMELWRAFLYPALQEIMSDLQTPESKSSALLAEIAPGLLTAVKVLDIAGLEDPVLMGATALVSAQVQWELGDHRGSIALVQQAIYTMDEHRMGRVDALQHIPEDVRDIFALQRGSFSTRADNQDWFHSLKRLGAHAFAGYGIFGLSSSADRGDQAMAEVQADLVAFYFRSELAYCVMQLAEKHRIRSILHREEKQRTAAAEALLKGIKLKVPAGDKGATRTMATLRAGTAKPTTMGTVNLSATLANSAFFAEGLNVETLPVFQSLRAYAAKNGYYRCILFLEMARIDTSFDRQSGYLQEALNAVEECEGREQLIKESFAELLVMTESSRRPPLIVARSHRYVYLAPVGCRRLKKASYYRIFAKEKGSGTDVSIHNDDLAGCERRVKLDDLHNLRNSVVRIGPLRPGEHYVFGSAGFTAEDKVTGGLSPTSVVIDAVNPLPTILLWNWLAQSAEEYGLFPMIKDASSRVVNRYFMQSPTPETRVAGKGVNLFLFREPSLCMLALQQSSPLLLQAFVDSCLVYEKLYQASNIAPHSSVNWTKDRVNQLEAMTSLHRTALVCTVACGLLNYELTLRTVKLGFDVALELLRFETVHLASHLTSPLNVLVLAMQTTPKRHWGVMEHKLYTKLLAYAAKAGALAKNITPVVAVLNTFYPEVLAGDATAAAASRPAESTLPDYSALFSTVLTCVHASHVGPFMDMMRKLAAPIAADAHALKESDPATATGVGYLWTLSGVARKLQLTNYGVDLLKSPDEKASAERIQIEKWVTAERPEKMSDYLETLVQLASEVSRTPQAAEVHRLVQRMPICSDFLAPRLVEVSAAWDCQVLQSLTTILAASQAPTISPRTAAAQKKAPAKGAPPEPTEAELQAAREAAMKVPDRFYNVSPEEQALQCRYLGELLSILAVQGFPGASRTINHFPASTTGPKAVVDPNTYIVDRGAFQQASGASSTGAADTSLPLPTSPRASLLPGNLSPALYVRLLGAAMDLLREAGANDAAAMVASKLWRFVVSEWKDPGQFALDFCGMQDHLMKIFTCAVVLLEQLSCAAIPAMLDDDASVGESVSSSVQPQLLESLGAIASDVPVSRQREVKENMLTLRELIVFWVKVEWIIAPANWDLVQLGSRAFKTILVNCPEYLKEFGDHCLPLIMNAQEAWIDKAQKFRAQKQSELDNFIFQYEEAQRKKRKKKLRVARLEKDEEELLFEAERDIYQQRVDAAQVALEATHEEMTQIKRQQAKFDRLYSNGSRAFDRVRTNCRLFMDEVRVTAANHPSGPITNAMELLRLYPDLDEKLHVLQTQFKPVFSVLREKKEKVLLVEALKLLGDVLLYFHRIAEAKSVWNDAIDGLFNVMDACVEWKTVSADAVASLEPHLIPGILPAVVVLSKLSRFCAAQDWDAKAGYARMAAELCRVPFQGSFGHPVSVVGFVAYQCVEVGGVFSLGMRDAALSSADLTAALHEVLNVLIAEKQYIAALPAVVLLEHFCAVYLNNPSMWFSARLLRLRLLVGAHLFAEAASMLASLRFNVQEIHTQTLSDAMRANYARQNESLKEFETSENGLNFHGYAPYFGHLTPDDETRNAAALQWIVAFPAEFEAFAKSYKIPLPLAVLTPEEQAAAEEERKAKAAEEAAAAAAAAKKAKGGKGKEEAPVVAEVVDNTSAPMFTPLQLSELHITCAHFLLEVAQLDARSTLPHVPKLQKLGAQGLDALTKASAVLFGLLPGAPSAPAGGAAPATGAADAPAAALLSAENVRHVRNRDWLRLYGRVHLLRTAYHIHTRNFKEARAASMGVLTLLRSSALAQGISGDVRGVLTQLWMAVKDDLITIADRQARFKDVLQLATESAREASMQLAGHWLRSYLLQRAQAHFKLGNIDEALSDCRSCAAQYEANKLEDLRLVRCLCLQATVLREQAVYAPKPQAVQAYLSCLQLIHRAADIADALAQRSGAFPADSNVTYGRSDTAVKKHHMITPVLQSLTDLHMNEPNLSLQAQFNKRKLHQHMGIDIPSLDISKSGPTAGGAPSNSTVAGNGITTSLARTSVQALPSGTDSEETQSSAQKFKLNNLRLAPVDRKEGVYCESEFANIYLEENRVLLGCQNLLCQVLDDARNAGLAGNSTFAEEYDANALVNEQLALGESALKLTRHCLYLPTIMRVSTLAYVSKARIAKKSKFEGNPVEFLETLVGPLTTALEVTVQSQSTQLWSLVRTICIELVEVYGDHDVDLGEELGPQRLKMAVVYLLAAIKVSNQDTALTKNSIGLAADASFDANPSEELKSLVANLSSSSATPDVDEMRRLAAAEAEAAAIAAKAPPAKGKAKAPPTGAAAGGSSLAPSGRDALYLLCSLLRERDPLWLYSPEQQLCADLHSLLRTSYPLYKTKCCLAESPNPNGALDVANATVSTLWIPTKSPDAFNAVLERQPNQFDYSTSGLYTHVSVFFLLGDAVLPTAATTAAGEAGNSKEPILTKLVLPRVDVVYIEKTLREIRDRLLDAEKKSYATVIRACQDEFGDALVLLLGLLKNGIITQEKPGSVEAARVAELEKVYRVVESKSATGVAVYELVLPVGESNTSIALKVTADLILHFAEVLCVDKDAELLKNNYISAFLRATLGFKVAVK